MGASQAGAPPLVSERTAIPFKFGKPVGTLSEIRAIEAEPLESRIPFHNLADLFASLRNTQKDRPALTFLHTGDADGPAMTWSHATFCGEVFKAANAFRRLGVDRRAGVAFLMPPHPLTHAVLWGSQCVGYGVSINFLLRPELIADMIKASRAKVLITPSRRVHPELFAAGTGLRRTLPDLEHVLSAFDPTDDGHEDVRALEVLMADENGAALDPTIAPADWDTAGALFHTGGTTGAPKLAQLTHGGQLAAAFGNGQLYGARTGDRIFNGLPLFHVGGTISFGLSILAAGGSNVLPTFEGFRNPDVLKNYWRIVERQGVTIAGGIPTTMAAALDAPHEGLDLSKLRLIISGGSAVPQAIAERIKNKVGVAVRQIYGMTETSGALTFAVEGLDDPTTAGLPIPYGRVAIATPNQPVEEAAFLEPGRSGEIVYQGPNVFDGYTDPRRTEDVMSNGWLRTGDLGHVDAQGAVFVTGRVKDIIIRGGHNIDPLVIEEAALSHDAVAQAAAIGRLDRHAGEAPVLFIVLRPGAAALPEDILAHTAERVNENPARPKAVTILEAMPVTAVGKIFKPDLRRLAAEDALALILTDHGFDPADCDIKVVLGEDGSLLCHIGLGDAFAEPSRITALDADLQRLQACVRIGRADGSTVGGDTP